MGKVFSAIWGECLSGLWHFDQIPLGSQLGAENQLLPVTFGL